MSDRFENYRDAPLAICHLVERLTLTHQDLSDRELVAKAIAIWDEICRQMEEHDTESKQ